MPGRQILYWCYFFYFWKGKSGDATGTFDWCASSVLYFQGLGVVCFMVVLFYSEGKASGFRIYSMYLQKLRKYRLFK